MYQQHWTASLTPLMAVGVALLLGAGLIWASGASAEAYGGLFAGMCGSWQALSETGVAATPYPDWPGSRARIQRWCVQYRG